MNIKEITEKLKDTIIPREVNKEEFELTEDEKKIVDGEETESKETVISDEIEDIDVVEEAPIRIKTVLVQESETEEEVKKRLSGAVKIAAGVGIVAVAGIAAVIFGSRKRR